MHVNTRTTLVIYFVIHTNERFVKLLRDYEREQDEQKALIETTRLELKEHNRSRTNVKSFIFNFHRPLALQ